MTLLGSPGSVLAATPLAALGAVLYLAIGLAVLALAVRWARDALGDAPSRAVPK